MENEAKTKQQLIDELAHAHQRIKALEALEESERLSMDDVLKQRERDNLVLLNRGILAFNATLDLDQILITALEEIQRIVDVTACSVWLLDPETDELVCRQATGEKSELVRGWRLRPGQGIANQVARSGKKQVVPDTRLNEIHFKEVDRQIGIEMRSILSVPLRVKEKVIGAIHMLHTEVDHFQPAHRRFLESLAATTATAIENVTSLENRVQTFAGLHLVGQSLLSVYDLDTLLGIVAETALNVLGSDLVILYEYVKEEDDVKVPPTICGNVRAPEVLHRRGLIIPHKESVVFKLLQRNTPFFAPNARQDWVEEDFFSQQWIESNESFISREGISSSAGVPLMIEGEAVGVLFVNYRIDRKFAANHQEIVKIFASQAALAIRNARIFSRVQRQANELEALHLTALNIGSEKEIQLRLEAIVEEAAKLLKAKGGKVYLRIPNQDKLELKAIYGIDPPSLYPVGSIIDFDDGMVGRVIQEEKPMIVADYAEFPGRIKDLENVFEAVIEVPLVLDGKSIGVLGVFDDRKKRQFSQADIPGP